jgi:pyrimidine deaminase RibD-like protein
MAPIMGENDCANPQQTCPRLPGEDYTKCRTICQQAGHAETVALKKALEWTERAGASLVGARAHLRGHHWICEPCGRALQEAGIAKVILNYDE